MAETMQTLHALLVDEIRDIYHAEKQITKALPKMIKNASNAELKAGFEKHLEETHEQILRLERVFDALDEKATAKTCEAMKGIIKEGEKTMGEDMEPEVMDAALVACAQKVEHYEIASYGTVIAWAEKLGLIEVVEELRATLEEERATDERLTMLAEGGINALAAKDEAA